MGRRADHSREELRAMALAAAREIVEAEGLDGLSARRIGRKIGYAAGTLYNVFDNLDDLIFHLNVGTLDAFYDVLTKKDLPDDPEQALLVLAREYIAFTHAHPRLWNAIFEHRLPGGAAALPDWHLERVLRLLGLIERALAPLFRPNQQALRLHAARVLWGAIYGIVSLEIAGKQAKTETTDDLAEILVTTFVAGLRAKQAADERGSV